MKLGNIMKQARIRVATAALAAGSLFSTGCDLEEMLATFETMGDADKTALIERHFNRDYNSGVITDFRRVDIGRASRGFGRIRISYNDGSWEQFRPFSPPNRFTPDWHATYDSGGMTPRYSHYISYGSIFSGATRRVWPLGILGFAQNAGGDCFYSDGNINYGCR